MVEKDRTNSSKIDSSDTLSSHGSSIGTAMDSGDSSVGLADESAGSGSEEGTHGLVIRSKRPRSDVVVCVTAQRRRSDCSSQPTCISGSMCDDGSCGEASRSEAEAAAFGLASICEDTPMRSEATAAPGPPASSMPRRRVLTEGQRIKLLRMRKLRMLLCAPPPEVGLPPRAADMSILASVAAVASC